MATRSFICIEEDNHSYKGIYCHWDGHPEHNGEILMNFYQTKEKVEDLLLLGDISILREEVSPPAGETHTFENPAYNVCVAYHRDRGEELRPASNLTITEAQDSWAEFLYVFCLDGRWRYHDLCHGKPLELKELDLEGSEKYYSKTESEAPLAINPEIFDDFIGG